jgi:hypothetical protein
VNRKPRFRSSIPSAAQPRIVNKYPSAETSRIEYVLDGSVVGYRDFSIDGALESDVGLRDGKRHGTSYRFEPPDKLVSATPYRNGLQHGLARQWGEDGRLIGWYRMRHGTGVDLWWQETWPRPGRPYVSEAHCEMDGLPHGYEWWLDEDQRSVWHERHWWRGQVHGVERQWNAKGALRRGFPAYFVRGERVTPRAYERARATDPTLPAFRSAENKPQRRFPAIVARRLARAVRGR